MGDEIKNESSSDKKDEDKIPESALNKHVDRIASVFEKFSYHLEHSYINRPFYKQPSFWTAFIAVSGILGLLFTWQQQVKAIEIDNIHQQISTIENFRAKENNAVTRARVLILNQTLLCPITNKETLIKLHQARMTSLIEITTFASNLDVSDNKNAKASAAKIINQIYSIKTDMICKIDPVPFDNELRSLQDKLNDITNAKIKKLHEKIFQIENTFF